MAEQSILDLVEAFVEGISDTEYIFIPKSDGAESQGTVTADLTRPLALMDWVVSRLVRPEMAANVSEAQRGFVAGRGIANNLWELDASMRSTSVEAQGREGPLRTPVLLSLNSLAFPSLLLGWILKPLAASEAQEQIQRFVGTVRYRIEEGAIALFEQRRSVRRCGAHRRVSQCWGRRRRVGMPRRCNRLAPRTGHEGHRACGGARDAPDQDEVGASGGAGALRFADSEARFMQSVVVAENRVLGNVWGPQSAGPSGRVPRAKRQRRVEDSGPRVMRLTMFFYEQSALSTLSFVAKLETQPPQLRGLEKRMSACVVQHRAGGRAAHQIGGSSLEGAWASLGMAEPRRVARGLSSRVVVLRRLRVAVLHVSACHTNDSFCALPPDESLPPKPFPFLSPLPCLPLAFMMASISME